MGADGDTRFLEGRDIATGQANKIQDSDLNLGPAAPNVGFSDELLAVLSNPEMSLKQGEINLFKRRVFGMY